MSTKQMKRLRTLFENESFKARLLELHKAGALVDGADCPAEDCNGTLEKKTISYMKDRELQFVEVLACKCGFQHRSTPSTEPEVESI